MKTLGAVILAVWIACSAAACSNSEKVIVLYRGSARLEPKAQVTLKGESIGYVDEVLPGDDITRVIVRLKSASLVHAGDRFSPRKDDAGKIGFVLQHIDGEPLKAGMEIEADPGLARRHRLTRPSELNPGRSMGPGGMAFDMTDPARIPPRTAESRAIDQREEMDQRRNRFEDQTERMLKVPRKASANLDAELVKRYEALAVPGSTPEELKQALATDGAALRADLDIVEQEARKAHDRQKMDAVRTLKKSIDRLERHAGRMGGTRAPRAPRERSSNRERAQDRQQGGEPGMEPQRDDR